MPTTDAPRRSQPNRNLRAALGGAGGLGVCAGGLALMIHGEGLKAAMRQGRWVPWASQGAVAATLFSLGLGLTCGAGLAWFASLDLGTADSPRPPSRLPSVLLKSVTPLLAASCALMFGGFALAHKVRGLNEAWSEWASLAGMALIGPAVGLAIGAGMNLGALPVFEAV